jgi:hypothetical protein
LNIEILTPYPEPEMVPIWAKSEDDVDFRNDLEAATRCTVCFAATELDHYLRQTVPTATLEYAAEPGPGSYRVFLSFAEPGNGQAFSIEPVRSENGEITGVAIHGEGRTGVLYGAYEFLRMQGWRWYEPGIEGEVIPEPTDSLHTPDQRLEFAPDYSGGRGFDLQARSMESTKLLFWMARNRMDTASYRALTGQLARKLGFQFKNGGHIFEPMLDPDRRMPSGKILWDEHREWYGKPEDGEPVKELALKRQFCVSQPDLIDFLASEIADNLRTIWKEVDILAVWGLDTCGEVCMYDSCKEKANASDRTV